MDNLQEFWDNFWQDIEKKTKENKGKFFQNPVSAPQFFKHYLNRPLFPRQQKVIDSTFTNNYKDISKEYNEYVIAFGKNAGKDFLICNLLAYLVYWLLCLHDPQEYLGIKSGEPIELANIAPDGDMAKTTFFERFCETLKRAKNPNTGLNPYEEFGMNLDRDILRNKIKFPKNITLYSANSVEFKLEGKNILFAVFDEVAQFRYDKTEEIRKHIKSSAKSRFPEFYKIFYISFLREEGDYMTHLLELADKNENMYKDVAATWEVRSLKHVSEDEASYFKKYVVFKENFEDDYEEDPIFAMLTYECKIPKVKTNSFIKNPKKILNCVNLERPFCPLVEKEIDGKPRYATDNLLNEEFEPYFKPNYTWEIWNLEKEYEKNPSKQLEEKIVFLKEQHQYSQYYLHIDLSRGIIDYAGICLGHPYYVLDNLKIYIDFVYYIKADPSKGEIDFDNIYEWIVKLYKSGWNLVSVTFDGYQSTYMKQRLEKEGISSDILSVDKTIAPYQTFKDVLYAEKITFPYFSPFIRELKELIKDPKRGKIDHPKRSQIRLKEEGIKFGSKDLADACAAITYIIISGGLGEKLEWKAI